MRRVRLSVVAAAAFTVSFAVVMTNLSGLRASAGGPVPIPEDECVALLGGSDCTTGNPNCGCATEGCNSTGDCGAPGTATTCTTDGATLCYKLVQDAMSKCGQANTNFPKGCSELSEPDQYCAHYYVSTTPSPYGCAYPAPICWKFVKDCGANTTTCSQK